MESVNDHRKQIQEALFDAASEIEEPAARKAFIELVGKGDPHQSEWLNETFNARDDADRFIRKIEQARTIVVYETGVDLSSGEFASDAGTASDPAEMEHQAGQRIGRYHLKECIGEGGCGVVYLAEQKEPVQRTVALKIIRLGMDTERVIARFELERQSLAMMDHPNIARVLDAGTTETGRPYFVMQWVRGPRITDYCDEHQLDIRGRIDLFISVCNGIQHAHQKGVLHRDIKPSNILVSETDGKPFPKVIDFGIAKAIEADAGLETAMSVHDIFVGTPAYMSPEQADLKCLDIDTRSDVYSLGALLYELLTGRPPFDPKKLAAAGLVEMRRTLAEREPPPPSAMLASLPADERNHVAACRRIDPARLTSAIRGDLDAVVMKAMEKERRHRYDTVNALAMDLQRFIDNEPVLAQPRSHWYLFSKFVRRNRFVVGATAAVITSLLLGLGVASLSYRRERAARMEQARLRDMAEDAHARERQRLAEARDWENMAQISMLLSEGKIEEADEQLRNTPAGSIKITPQSASVLRSLGNWNALRGRWNEAARWLTMLMAANEMIEPAAVETSDLLSTSAALVESGNKQDYNLFRQKVLQQFSPPIDNVMAERVIHATLLLPADAAILRELESVKQMLESTEFDPHHLRPGWETDAAIWRAWAVAMVEYRSGDFEEARVWNQRALLFPVLPKFMPAILHSLQAMIESKLGNHDAAIRSLAEARDVIDYAFAPELPAAYEPMGKKGGFWWDWIAARILYQEAQRILGAGSSR